MKRIIQVLTLVLLSTAAEADAPTLMVSCQRDGGSAWEFTVGERQAELCLTMKHFSGCANGKATESWEDAADLGLDGNEWLLKRTTRVDFGEFQSGIIFRNSFTVLPDGSILTEHLVMDDGEAGFSYFQWNHCKLVNANAVLNWIKQRLED